MSAEPTPAMHATREPDTAAAAATSPPALYVVLSNQSSKQNLGTFLRTASAFGATQVIVVGTTRFGTHGAHRAHKYVDIVHVYKFSDARAYLQRKGCTIVGVRAQADAVAAHLAPFKGATAFVLDNEVAGLSPEQIAICDMFVYVPMHGIHATAAPLDATVVAAIVLQRFTQSAKFAPRSTEATSTQGKFVLDAFPTPQVDAHKTAERALKRAADAAAADDVSSADFARIFE